MFYEMNEVVLDHGGKIYFGKTPIINKTQFYKMFKLNQNKTGFRLLNLEVWHVFEKF